LESETKESVTIPEIVNYNIIYKSRFMDSFSDLTSMNTNINTDFSDKKQLQTTLTDGENDLEKQWKRRILFEYTPRGNVVMYYDAYKLGFAYFCDQHVPYDVLNAVAMKYVLTYKCVDFFMDEIERPEENPSSLLHLLVDDKPAPKNSENKKKQKNTSGPFAKLKTYNTVSSKLIKNEEKTEPEKEKQRNCFINRGKIMNFQFLQKSVLSGFSSFNSDLLDGLEKNTNVQKEVFSYRDYKTFLENKST